MRGILGHRYMHDEQVFLPPNGAPRSSLDPAHAVKDLDRNSDTSVAF